MNNPYFQCSLHSMQHADVYVVLYTGADMTWSESYKLVGLVHQGEWTFSFPKPFVRIEHFQGELKPVYAIADMTYIRMGLLNAGKWKVC